MANPHVQSIAQSKEESIRKVIEFNRLSYPLEENTETNEEYYALSSPEKLGKEGQYFRFRSFPTNGENDGDDHDFKDYDKFSNKAAMEMKIKLIQNEEESPNGARLVMGKNRISTYCNIPNVPGGRFFGAFGGSSGFVAKQGYAETSFSLGYKIFPGYALLCDWNTADGRSKSTCGLSHTHSKGYLTEVKRHFHPPMNEDIVPFSEDNTLYSFSTSGEPIPGKIRAGLQLSYVPTNLLEVKSSSSKSPLGATLNLSTIKTTEHINHVPDIEITLSTKSSHPLKVSFSQDGLLQKHQKVELQLGCGPNQRYECMALLTRKLHDVMDFSIGICLESWEGLSWVFKLKGQDFCFQVPIQVSALKGPSSSISSTVMHRLSIAYLSLLSGVIDAAIGDYLFGNGEEDSNINLQLEEQHLQNSMKAHQDAKLQMKLMSKKAKSNMKSEEASNGLVIVKAIYFCQNSELQLENSLDVTVALQFWVSNSKLDLAGSSKSNMLGFYDIRSQTKEPSHDGGWRKAWKVLFEPNAEKETVMAAIPLLNVRYKFGGELYDITIRDDEKLELPNTAWAIRVET